MRVLHEYGVPDAVVSGLSFADALDIANELSAPTRRTAAIGDRGQVRGQLKANSKKPDPSQLKPAAGFADQDGVTYIAARRSQK